ncbi:hypothetical protein [Streptomyces zaomyceticus]|uniref:hypothetical protein n=1 Tax=Streptomyces zaomyceticus TaxID=68286 RepID=UPI0036C2D247
MTLRSNLTRGRTYHLLDDHTPRRQAHVDVRSLTQRLQSHAFHEAGHAVLGMLAGLTCEHVKLHRVEQDGFTGWSGVTRWAPSTGRPLDLAVALGAAGEVAALRQLEESGQLNAATARAVQSDHDKQAVISLLAAAGHPVSDSASAARGSFTWEDVRKQARDDVLREWPCITAVALALLADPDFTLSGDQAAQAAGMENPVQRNEPGL